ncbi:MAG: NAD-dependent epimerase/dehydratase family protein [Ignavibacteriaceae bacterium]|nr:NAD-dependent epimerase/dehydratase family protein [Ignavibacteriaceae bacterium]
MSKPILVTGGAGFIGSHLIDLFDAENVEYIVLDNLSNGSVKNISTAISKNCFLQGDVKNFKLVEELVSSASCVIHLACNVGVRNVIDNPLETIETNVNSLKQIAYYCSINDIPLVFFSTSLVYSPHKEKKAQFSETDQTNTLGFHPVSMYVYSKKMGELLCNYYKKEMGLNYVIIRPFNMIGIRQQNHSGMVVPAFIKSAISSKTIDIYGDGRQTRTFSDVKTAMKLLWKIIKKDTSYGQIFNLATTEKSTPIIELAEMINGILNEPIKINFIPINQVYGDSYRDVKFRTPSLAKLKQHISAWDERDLKEILKEIIEYERQISNLN